MALRKRLGLFLLVFLLIALILFLFIQYKKKQIISDLTYLELPGLTISVDQTEIALLKRTITLKQAQIFTFTPTDSVQLTVSEIRIRGIQYAAYMFKNLVQIDSLIIDSPHILLNQCDSLPPPPTNENHNSPKLQIKNLLLKNGKLLHLDATKDSLIAIDQMQLGITDLSIDQPAQDIPQFKDYTLVLSDASIKPNTLSRVRIDHLEFNKDTWQIENLSLTPIHDKFHYSKYIPYQDDWISGSITNLTLHKPDITQITDSIFKADHIAVNGLQLAIYRDKHIARKNTTKPMLTALLNDIPLKISLDSILIDNGKLTYGERMPKNSDYGSVTLTNIQNNIYRLNTIIKDTVLINFSATSGSQGIVKGTCTLPLASKNQHFDMHLYMHKVNFNTFNSFTGTNMNITNEGMINNAYINASGNQVSATGRSYLNYDDFEVTLVNKKSGSAKKILSSIANMIVPKKRDKNEEKTFTVTRNQERSFFNYMWLCAQKGITVNMI